MRRVEDVTARDRCENSAVARIRLGGQTGRQLDGDEAMCGFAIRGNRSRGNRAGGNRSRGNRAGGWPSDVGSRSGIKRF
jgi:hypothetical protein